MVHCSHSNHSSLKGDAGENTASVFTGVDQIKTNEILGLDGRRIPLNYTLEHSRLPIASYYGAHNFGIRAIHLYLAKKKFPTGDSEPTCFLSFGKSINNHQANGFWRVHENVLNFSEALSLLAKSALYGARNFSISGENNPYIVSLGIERYEIRDFIRKLDPLSGANSTLDSRKHIISYTPEITVVAKEISPLYSRAVLMPIQYLDDNDHMTAEYGFILRGMIENQNCIIFDETVLTIEEAAKHLENLYKLDVRDPKSKN